MGGLSIHNQLLRGYSEDSTAFRPLLLAMADLTVTVDRLTVAQQELGPSVQRLNELELSRVRFEAECEGMLLKADGKLNAAKAAEARERQFKRSVEKTLADPFPEDVEDGTALAVEAAAGPAPKGPGLYMTVSPNNKKALAQAAKWGR